MNFKFLYIPFIIFFLSSAVSTFAQYDALGNPVFQDNALPQIQNNLNESQRASLEPRPVSNIENDEYGPLGYNVFLGGLGANGGYAVVPDAGGIYNLTSNGSIEAWVFPTAATSSAPGIVAKGDASNVAFLFGWQASTSLIYFRIGNVPTVNTGGTLVPLNQWSHVAVTWTGSAGNYTVTFYVNGAQSGAPVNNIGTWNSTTDSLTIGITKPFGGNTFYGYIDEVKIWNNVRTLAQLRDNRFVGLGDYVNANAGNAITSCAHYTGLLSSWTFNGATVADDIGGRNGFIRSGAGFFYFPWAGYPIPYNYTLQRAEATLNPTSYVTVPYNSAFDLTTTGTVEMWYYTTNIAQTQWLVSKGSTANVTWGIAMASTNRLAVRFGNLPVINSDGVAIPLNKWVHIAFAWSGTAGNYQVRCYVNGFQSGSTINQTGTMGTNTDPLTIGNSIPFNGFGLRGYLDEVRIWNVERTAAQIRNTMLISGRGLLPNANLVGIWNFDGNLRNFSATSGIDGSFNTSGTNNCRLSGYVNETFSGPPVDANLQAHPTVINGTALETGFIKKISNTPIPDNSTMTDTIRVTTAGTLNDIQVFLAIQHTYTPDLDISLKAPNGTSVVLSNDNGGDAAGVLRNNGYLTIFDDTTGPLIVTSTIFLAPWSNYVKPQNAMGIFGGTPINGDWVITIGDDLSGNTGILLGWGIRLNNSLIVGSGNLSDLMPSRFNLYQNYPNPFNPVTNIKFDLLKNVRVKLKVYDLLGREVKKLLDEFREAGTHIIEFDASEYASGVYFYKIEAGDYSNTKKLVLLK